MIVKPGQNPDGSGPLFVRDQYGRVMNSDGADVPETTFWHRRILHGDVELVTEPEAAKTSAKPTKAEAKP